jgi:hypothetical protein
VLTKFGQVRAIGSPGVDRGDAIRAIFKIKRMHAVNTEQQDMLYFVGVTSTFRLGEGTWHGRERERAHENAGFPFTGHSFPPQYFDYFARHRILAGKAYCNGGWMKAV